LSLFHYNKAIFLLREHNLSFEHDIPTKKDIVAAAERRLGIEFPPSYKQYLSEFGLFDFEGKEFYGIINNNLNSGGIPDVIYATETARQRGEISKSMVLVRESGYGPFFVIDCSQKNSYGESPVFEINEMGYEHGSKLEAETFGHFLLKEVESVTSQLT
jgi:hypothetical protein